ncbi:unnamed protein product [Anisakis simplex]|uniref:RNA-binding S4 domain-containing protein n=1 Tax=Anisakis simplex TaxID=6269 RepID=A0A0M3J8G5_ANISI|nr:unnamed protein product [Anisakis simplex]
MRQIFQFCFEPVPQQVRPILHLSAAQRAARRLSMKASAYLSKKRVCINAEPVVIDITPRSGKIPGVIKMPDSPELLDDEPSAETCIATCRRNILPRLEIDQVLSSFSFVF